MREARRELDCDPVPSPVVRAPPLRVAGLCRVFGDTDGDQHMRKHLRSLTAHNAGLKQTNAGLEQKLEAAQAQLVYGFNTLVAMAELRTRGFVKDLSRRDPRHPACLIAHVKPWFMWAWHTRWRLLARQQQLA